MDPVEEAVRMARRSVMGQRHGAVITRSGCIVARGCNRRVSHYHHIWSQHAEVSAICDLKKRFPVESQSRKWMRECRLYVVRVGSDEQGNPLKHSLPCPSCTRAIAHSCIPVVFYSCNQA